LWHALPARRQPPASAVFSKDEVEDVAALDVQLLEAVGRRLFLAQVGQGVR
jgi:hypothetical protein